MVLNCLPSQQKVSLFLPVIIRKGVISPNAYTQNELFGSHGWRDFCPLSVYPNASKSGTSAPCFNIRFAELRRSEFISVNPSWWDTFASAKSVTAGRTEKLGRSASGAVLGVVMWCNSPHLSQLRFPVFFSSFDILHLFPWQILLKFLKVFFQSYSQLVL